MKINDVEAILLKGSQTYQTSTDDGEAVDQGDWQMLVKVSTDEGVTGVGQTPKRLHQQRFQLFQDRA